MVEQFLDRSRLVLLLHNPRSQNCHSLQSAADAGDAFLTLVWSNRIESLKSAPIPVSTQAPA